MPAPALRIPVSAEMADFERGMSRAKQVTEQATQFVVKRFVVANTEIGRIGRETAADIAAGWARSAAATAGAIGAVIVISKAFGAVVGSVREQLAEMVDIADKARASAVTPAFLQSFRAEARKLQIDVKDLDASLANAFEATKERSPINLSEWETAGETITDVEKALRVYNETIAKVAGTQLEGLVLFRDAEDQQAKVVAVLEAMRQLESLGHRLEAIDLAERMFGTRFADNIRRGQTSAESMLSTIRATSASSQGLFSNEMIARVKEVDDRLLMAQDHLSRELKPTWDSVATTITNVKSLLADIVELTAKAAELANSIDLGRWVAVIAPALPGVNALVLALRAVNALSSGQAQQGGPLKLTVTPSSRGVGAPPTRKETDDSTALRTRVDLVQRYLDGLRAANAELEAELATFGQGNAAREQAVALARAKAAAQREGRDLAESEVDAIKDAAAEHARLTEELEKRRDLQREIASLSHDFADAFKDAVFEGQKLDQVVGNLLKRLASRGIDTAFSGLFGALGNAIAGPGGQPMNILPPAMQAHTGGVIGADSLPMRSIAAGHYRGAPRFHSGGLAGDEVPAILRRGEGVFTPAQMRALGNLNVDIPRTLGAVNVAAPRAADGPVNAPVTFNIDARGAQAGVGEEIAGAMKALLDSQAFQTKVIGAVRGARSRRMV